MRYGFFRSLLPAFVGDVGSGSGKDILSLRRYFEVGDLESIRNASEKNSIKRFWKITQRQKSVREYSKKDGRIKGI